MFAHSVRCASRSRKTDGRGGAGTGGFHPLGELALELETFIHWASWRWNWKLASIGRVGAGNGSVHPLGESVVLSQFFMFSLLLF